MTPAAIIRQAAVDGVRIALSPAGTVKMTGSKVAVARWVEMVRDNKLGIIALLKGPANDVYLDLDIFDPALTADPDTHRRWSITIPGRDVFSVIVIPEANHGQMKFMYPTAVSIIPEAE